MAKLNISQAAKLYRKDRSSIQRKIKKGELSCELNENGHKQIDLAELIRVYGEPPKTDTVATPLQSDELQHQYTPNATPFLEDKITTLERQIEALEKDKENMRTDLTDERETRKQLEKQLVKIIEQQHQLMLEDKREKNPIQPTSDQSETPENKTTSQKSRLGFWTLFVGGIAITIIMTALVTIWILHSDNPLGFIPSIISQFFT